MKTLVVKILLILFTINVCHSQAWMTSLEIAQKLAFVQNKMVLMVWEETTKYPYPVLVDNDKGKTVFVENLFTDELLSPLIWKHFVPVIVNENQYADWYLEIKGKRKPSYIDKFNDDSIKIMDINGNIYNATDFFDNYENITELIQKYTLNTSFIAAELKNYSDDKNFYSSYYLASKYLDFALYVNVKIRPAIINLSNIYLEEAIAFAEKTDEDELLLKQRCELLKIKEYLILRRPKKVLRQLKSMKAGTIENKNKSFAAFLYYVAFRCQSNVEDAEIWKSKVSLVNLKKAELIINLNF